MAESRHARIIDGDGLWGSKKIEQLEDWVQPEYSNLVPLAGVNGTFEFDVRRIWQKVYAGNRHSITVETVEKIMQELVRVDLLRTWEQDGKTFGFWVGIDKPGLLPPPAVRARYKNDPPPPPDHIRNTKPESNNPTNVAAEETEITEDEEMTAKQKIKCSAQKYFKVFIRDDDPAWSSIKILFHNLTEKRVAADFEEWAAIHTDDGLRRPLSAFASFANGETYEEELSEASQHKSVEDIQELSNLASDLYLIANQGFTGKLRIKLGKLLEAYSAEELKKAYIIFISNKDDFALKNAARDFVEGGAEDVIAAQRKLIDLQKKQEEMMEKIDQKVRADMAKKKAAEDAEAADEPDTFELP